MACQLVKTPLRDDLNTQLLRFLGLFTVGVGVVHDQVIHLCRQRGGQLGALFLKKSFQRIAVFKGPKLAARGNVKPGDSLFPLPGQLPLKHRVLFFFLPIFGGLFLLVANFVGLIIQHQGDELRLAGFLGRLHIGLYMFGCDQLFRAHQGQQRGLLHCALHQLCGVVLDVFAVGLEARRLPAAARCRKTADRVGPESSRQPADVFNYEICFFGKRFFPDRHNSIRNHHTHQAAVARERLYADARHILRDNHPFLVSRIIKQDIPNNDKTLFIRKAAAAGERLLANARHATRNRHARQAAAVIESAIADLRHALWDYHTPQASAVLERLVTDLRHTLRDRHTCQALTAPERRIADTRHTRRDCHARQAFAAVEGPTDARHHIRNNHIPAGTFVPG